jgi:hypothetical protein
MSVDKIQLQILARDRGKRLFFVIIHVRCNLFIISQLFKLIIMPQILVGGLAHRDAAVISHILTGSTSRIYNGIKCSKIQKSRLVIYTRDVVKV